MSWSNEHTPGQRAERHAQRTALRRIGWRGPLDMTGHPVNTDMGKVPRGYYIGPATDRRSTSVDAAAAEWLHVHVKGAAIHSGGYLTGDGDCDAGTHWRRRSAPGARIARLRARRRHGDQR